MIARETSSRGASSAWGRVVREEAPAPVVDDVRPLAPDRLGEEEPRDARQVEGRGVELDELQVGELRPPPGSAAATPSPVAPGGFVLSR